MSSQPNAWLLSLLQSLPVEAHVAAYMLQVCPALSCVYFFRVARPLLTIFDVPSSATMPGIRRDRIVVNYCWPVR